jgi:hypothetical protein
MHIRTIGELHDVINAQAKEIAQLKADLLDSQNNLSSTRFNFKAYRTANEVLNPRSRSAKLRTHIIKVGLVGKTNKDKISELAAEFSLSKATVKELWQELNFKGAKS